jgi:hypothetical protein
MIGTTICPGKREAFAKLAEMAERIVNPTIDSNIVPLRR